jgi:hypothetical protein
VNFLDAHCQSGPFTFIEFGLCDDETSTVAYVDTTDREKWIAIVENPNRREVTFTAIDKCVINDDEQLGIKRCDCMLTTDQVLYLVELKEWSRSNWQSRSIEQLESTIKLILATHGEDFLNSYRPKKAFVCNRKKAPFFKPEFNTKNRFYRDYQFRLHVQTTVQIR